MSIKTREERKQEARGMIQSAENFSCDTEVVTIEEVEGLIDSMFVDHVLDGTIVDGTEDYVILHTHESKPHPQALSSNYTYSVVRIFSTKQGAESECKHNEAYQWRGNGTGSVSWKAIKRSEVPKEAKWEV